MNTKLLALIILVGVCYFVTPS